MPFKIVMVYTYTHTLWESMSKQKTSLRSILTLIDENYCLVLVWTSQKNKKHKCNMLFTFFFIFSKYLQVYFFFSFIYLLLFFFSFLIVVSFSKAWEMIESYLLNDISSIRYNGILIGNSHQHIILWHDAL